MANVDAPLEATMIIVLDFFSIPNRLIVLGVKTTTELRHAILSYRNQLSFPGKN
jgi:hypothetical protein